MEIEIEIEDPCYQCDEDCDTCKIRYVQCFECYRALSETRDPIRYIADKVFCEDCYEVAIEGANLKVCKP